MLFLRLILLAALAVVCVAGVVFDVTDRRAGRDTRRGRWTIVGQVALVSVFAAVVLL